MSRSAFPPATWVAIVLSVIGAINWGLVRLFPFHLVSAIFGTMSPLSRIIYVLVGLSGVYLLFAAATAESRGAPPRATL